MKKENTCKDLLGNIHIQYYKSKIALAEAHLLQDPENYIKTQRI